MLVFGIMRPEGVVEGEFLLFHYLAALGTDIGSVSRVWDQQCRRFCMRVHLNKTLRASFHLCGIFSRHYDEHNAMGKRTSRQKASDSDNHPHIPPSVVRRHPSNWYEFGFPRAQGRSRCRGFKLSDLFSNTGEGSRVKRHIFQLQ